MKDIVSARAASLVAWTASSSILCSISSSYGLSWTVLAWANLALAAAGLVTCGSSPLLSPAPQGAAMGSRRGCGSTGRRGLDSRETQPR